MNAPLSNERISAIIKLILRSPDIGDEWRNVSPAAWGIIGDFCRQHPDLAGCDGSAEAGGKVRLTEIGQAVGRYLP